MAKKRIPKQPGDGDVPPATKKERTGSRHKPRRMVAVRPTVYGQLTKLAEQNERPISWELNSILIKALREAGLWPITKD